MKLSQLVKVFIESSRGCARASFNVATPFPGKVCRVAHSKIALPVRLAMGIALACVLCLTHLGDARVDAASRTEKQHGVCTANECQ
eukprot:CAMPEP_0172747770 /NCGR_PEP_ID=MMETSP1074-20121228/143563_1 /TAXON_ID=2916 /ORGANISM="Ceratium fusus, Strain PA161109" /LENGTH=85 /DNA_ID=CAMNT_0013579367 /DNA_START=105 /DNA_END=362 /DNA_ORIENTATION=+